MPQSSSSAPEQLICAVLPTIVPPRPAPAPIAVLPPPASRARRVRRALGSVAIDVARTDLSGRVRVASLLRVLGWLPGLGIDLDVSGGAIVIRVGPDGRHKIGALGEIRLPVSVRTMAGIAAESTVFMAALVDRGLLVIHPARSITRALHRTYAGLIGELDAG